MIRKMRLKFIAITLGALILLLLSILISTNLVMRNSNERNTNEILHNLVMNDGQVPRVPKQQAGHPPGQEEMTEAFSVKLDFDNEITEILDDDTLDDEVIIIMVDSVIESDDSEGKIDDYQYIYADKDYGKIIVFANQGVQNQLLEDLKNISYIIGIIGILVLSVVVFFLSKQVTKPIEISFDKQKRFVSDSGHELKTPLSILSANADMLQMEIGDNEWLMQIKQQSSRMNKLIHELLLLAKTEDMNASVSFMEFNLAHCVENTVLPLEVIAFEKGNEIKCNVEDNVYVLGNEKRIAEMVEALMDNAIKYSEERTPILVNLYQKGSKKIIEICNKGNGIDDEDKEKLFEKFYRKDDSRSRETGGYGLGLSIVKNIVDMHKGKIEIDTKTSDMIVFRVILN